MTPGLHIAIERHRLRLRSALRTEGIAPLRIDHRCELLDSSNQGETSQCAAYAMAGVIEYERWKWAGVQAQVDPSPIYRKAKELDEIDGEGTTLEAVLQAASLLALIPEIAPGSIRVIESAADVRQALHRYDVVLAGFEIDEGWFHVTADGWIRKGRTPQGGHAVLLCGYADDAERWLGLQNSWGSEGYGWRGFCRIAPELFVEQFRYGLVWDYASPRYR